MSFGLSVEYWLRFVILLPADAASSRQGLSVRFSFAGKGYIIRRHRVGFLPDTCGDLQGIDPVALPPRALVAAPMQLAVMKPAKGNREAVTDFPPHRALFCKFEVVGIRRGSTTRQTGLGGNKLQMMAIALAHGLADDGDGLLLRIKANRVSRQCNQLIV